MNTCYEIASWLDANGNADGMKDAISDNASDIEFAEIFALLDFARNGRGIPACYDTYAMIMRMDVNGLCEHLKAILYEIQGIVEDKMKEEMNTKSSY